MNFDSYITSGTKTAFTVDVNQKLIKYNKFSLKKAAFTLAETLITLTIIGVVAALTIPNLISKYQKHTYVVGLKKAYSQLQNAVKMIPITQGCPAGDFDCAGWNDEWDKATNIEGQEFNGRIYNKRTYLLSKQFKINKLCYGGSTDEICKKIENIPTWSFDSAFITNDGMIFSSSGVDINGFKGPNKWGRDQFAFEINSSPWNSYQGIILPLGSKLLADIHGEEYYWRNNNQCTTENVNKGTGTDWYGRGACTGRVLEEDAMNY